MKAGIFVSMALSALVAAGVFVLLDSTRGPDSASSGAATDDGALRSRVEDLAERIQRNTEVIESLSFGTNTDDRVAKLENRIRELEEALADIGPGAAPESPKVADVAPGAEPTADTPPEQVLAWAEATMKRKDLPSAGLHLQKLLERELPDELRLRALKALGQVQWWSQDFEQAEDTFEEMLRLAKSGTIGELEANYHLALTNGRREDYAAAIRHAEDLIRSPVAHEVQVGWARIRIAEYSLSREDPSRARTELEHVLTSYGDTSDPKKRWLTNEARKMLRSLNNR